MKKFTLTVLLAALLLALAAPALAADFSQGVPSGVKPILDAAWHPSDLPADIGDRLGGVQSVPNTTHPVPAPPADQDIDTPIDPVEPIDPIEALFAELEEAMDTFLSAIGSTYANHFPNLEYSNGDAANINSFDDYRAFIIAEKGDDPSILEPVLLRAIDYYNNIQM